MIKRPSTLRFHTNAQFNITPMIDVVFLLIIFFMLSCLFIVQENYALEVPDNCPAAIVPDALDRNAITMSVFTDPSADQNAEKKAVLFAVRAKLFDPRSGDYTANPDKLLADMTESIGRQAKNKPNPLVYLRADRDLTYSDVQDSLIALSRAGINRVQLAVFRTDQNTTPNPKP